MSQVTLILNTGSSSIKFAVYTGKVSLTQQWRGKVEGIGTGRARISAKHEIKKDINRTLDVADHKQALQHLLTLIDDVLGNTKLYVIGHRVVHGGKQFSKPVIVTANVLQELKGLSSLAPLHQPHNLLGIELLAELRAQVPQVACFDTAFHQTMPPLEQIYALPRALTESGVCRYGFHGLSYEYIAKTLPTYVDSALTQRVVVAHLGQGASLCALSRGVSIATTMGFSPLDGIPMATRSGGLDPSVVFYLHRERGMAIDEIEQMLNQHAGLLGISGQSADMRELLDSSDQAAKLAVDLFVYHVVRAIGSLAAVLGGVDAVVFTAGIGEHAAAVREQICRGCAWIGLQIDPAANLRHGPCISLPESPVSAWVIPTNEELMIAQHSVQQIKQNK